MIFHPKTDSYELFILVYFFLNGYPHQITIANVLENLLKEIIRFGYEISYSITIIRPGNNRALSCVPTALYCPYFLPIVSSTSNHQAIIFLSKKLLIKQTYLGSTHTMITIIEIVVKIIILTVRNIKLQSCCNERSTSYLLLDADFLFFFVSDVPLQGYCITVFYVKDGPS